MVLEIHDENVVQDKMIGTCGQIPLERVSGQNHKVYDEEKVACRCLKVYTHGHSSGYIIVTLMRRFDLPVP